MAKPGKTKENNHRIFCFFDWFNDVFKFGIGSPNHHLSFHKNQTCCSGPSLWYSANMAKMWTAHEILGLKIRESKRILPMRARYWQHRRSKWTNVLVSWRTGRNTRPLVRRFRGDAWMWRFVECPTTAVRWTGCIFVVPRRIFSDWQLATIHKLPGCFLVLKCVHWNSGTENHVANSKIRTVPVPIGHRLLANRKY